MTPLSTKSSSGGLSEIIRTVLVEKIVESRVEIGMHGEYS